MIPHAIRHAIAGLAVVTSLVPGSLAAQEWTWPEEPKNLQVLKDLRGEKLRPVMFGFTRSLGVRCTHCHVGEEGAPLTTYDFAADTKPAKSTAREMLRMLDDINGHLEKIEPSGPQRVNMSCNTCHRGRPRPIELGVELSEVFHAQGADSMVAKYRALKEAFLVRGSYDFGEHALLKLGYELLSAGETRAAVQAFQLNVEAYPQSSNAYDSLGEAYLAAGQLDLARENYAKSLELDPKNTNAAEKLKEIESSPVEK